MKVLGLSHQTKHNLHGITKVHREARKSDDCLKDVFSAAKVLTICKREKIPYCIIAPLDTVTPIIGNIFSDAKTKALLIFSLFF